MHTPLVCYIAVNEHWRGGHDGSVPGSIAVLFQDIINARAAAFCVITNTRPVDWQGMTARLWNTTYEYVRNVVPY
jgi:hypothetical protein